MMIDPVVNAMRNAFRLVMTAPTPSMSVVVLMVSVLLSVFLFRLVVRRHRIRMARESIPFVVGGWGTRGKSGTERKKAALFEGLGYHVTSKTTGCEAMVIHARPGQDAVELPIYRPGDKATIWEQGRLVEWAGRFKSQVFLWECMALGPDYAEILQHDWMNDDIATLSNTFVDHENIQGPTGMDVTRALTSFIPRDGELFTSEDLMLPAIEDVCRRRNTRCFSLSWRESELIGSDVLEQFPYTVHPRNLGMVTKLAAHLGIDRNVALREIRSHIIPDLGSFKSYRTRFRSRFIEFWNGMSANDRVSTIGNYQKAGFYDVKNGDKTWCVTIVNNRDDRIIRSREFADIVVNDTPANMHLLIGTNLTGLYGYLMDSIRQFAMRKSLIGRSHDLSKNRGIYDILRHDALVLFKRLKTDGYDREAIVSKVTVMLNRNASDAAVAGFVDALIGKRIVDAGLIRERLETLGCELVHIDDVVFQITRDMKDYLVISDFFDFLKMEVGRAEYGETSVGTINERFRYVLVELFRERIVVLSNSYLTGDQVIDRVTHCLPPFYSVKLMGMQNIKGTGLDFVYRWVSLDKVKSAIADLESDNVELRGKALDFLSDYRDYGILDAPPALNALKHIRKNMAGTSPETVPQIDEAIARIQRRLEKNTERLNAGVRHGGLRRSFLHIIEQFREAGDSKRRKKASKMIMEDLFHQRISHTRAAVELQKLKKRQEGGWMQQVD